MSNVKEKEFSTISVYIDEDENMIGIPCGESDKYGIADIDKVVLLKAPYSDSQIENFVEEVISYCYTKKHNDSSPLSTIEKYTKKTGFVNATADYTLISIVKTKETYSLMPTFNDYERGPLVIDDDERILLANYQKGELAEVMKDFIQVYVKANMFYKEKQELEEEKKNRKKQVDQNCEVSISGTFFLYRASSYWDIENPCYNKVGTNNINCNKRVENTYGGNEYG